MATKKIVDVAHPGKSAPAGNPKSVIITKHAVVQDPMVADDKAEASAAVLDGPSTKKKIIQPLSASELPAEEPKEELTPVAPAPDAAPAEKPVEAPKPVPITQPQTEKEAGDKGVVNEDAQQAAEAETLQKQADAVQKLIDTKQYYLPIKSSEQRRTKRTVIIGLLVSVILGAAWVNIALDAGIIQIDGLQPLTHFFSN